MEIKLYAKTDGQRIDKYIAENVEEISRSHIQKLIEEGRVLVNGISVRSKHKLKTADEILICVPEPTPTDILPENIPLDILYEDSDVIIVNKPKGMVVHPSAGHPGGTLVNALMYHTKSSLSGINGELRPGIVHRIDKDTTGSLIVCKNDRAHLNIAEQIKEHSVNRIYRGIVKGTIKEDSGTIRSLIGRDQKDRKKMSSNTKCGREAITHYRVLERFKNATYVEFKLETGRTHQIRVHMAGIGHPLLGDTVYGSSKNPYHLTGQTLHAMTIGFVHPTSGEYLEFSAPVPEYFSEILIKLRRE